MTAIWSVLVLVWGVAVLVLLGRCSYYLKQLLKKESDRKEP
jgi:hypothetical protein